MKKFFVFALFVASVFFFATCEIPVGNLTQNGSGSETPGTGGDSGSGSETPGTGGDSGSGSETPGTGGDSGSGSETPGTGGDKLYKIDDRGPGGGWIFYDADNYSKGWRYLEAADVNLDPTSWDKPNRRLFVSGAEFSETNITIVGFPIGKGKANTKAMLEQSGGDGMNAARAAVNYRGGGKSDWFLPSRGEMAEMRKVFKEKGITDFNSSDYWTSTQFSDSSAPHKTVGYPQNQFAWTFKFGSTLMFEGRKCGGGYIKPVRAF